MGFDGGTVFPKWKLSPRNSLGHGRHLNRAQVFHQIVNSDLGGKTQATYGIGHMTYLRQGQRKRRKKSVYRFDIMIHGNFDGCVTNAVIFASSLRKMQNGIGRMLRQRHGANSLLPFGFGSHCPKGCIIQAKKFN